MEWNAEEQAAEDAAREAAEAARAAHDEWKVLEARAAYLWAVSPSVATYEWPMNISGAARMMGKPRPTVRPYVFAGEALDHAGRIDITARPGPVDIEIVEAALEKYARAPRRENNRKWGR